MVEDRETRRTARRTFPKLTFPPSNGSTRSCSLPSRTRKARSSAPTGVRAKPRRIAMEWVFSEQSYLLGFVERMGGRPSKKDTASTVARHQVEVDRIER